MGCWQQLRLPVPLRGVLSVPFRAFGIRPSRMNPNTCTICELMFTTVMTSMGPQLNGIVNYETWVPSMMTPSAEAFLKVYQSRAAAEGVDPLGYYLGTWGYAYLELLGGAITGAKSLNDDQIAQALAFRPELGGEKFESPGGISTVSSFP